MGRKNRRGRGANQNPRRFYRPKRQGYHNDEEAVTDVDFDLTGGDVWSARARRKRRRRSGAVDAVESMMEAALRHDQRELVQDSPGETAPSPLWLIDAADVKSLPHPSGRGIHDAPPHPAKAAICGNCREWVPPGDPHASIRGRCLHPASGVSYPPSDYEACPFFA